MARLLSKTLFFITSPRSPMKMLPEIHLLVKHFEGHPWNNKTQTAFMYELSQDPRFEGTGSFADMAFSARDRINRAPKALGFVDLYPTIQLTDAGKKFLDEDFTEEIFLRQLLKFQLPSPYHTQVSNNKIDFCVKPYLEIFRLIYTLGKITFDEMMIFGMQLTNYKKFNEIVNKIKQFREAIKNHTGNYKTFTSEYLYNELIQIYKDDIETGKTKTRESSDTSLIKFLRTKANNLRDYTDACFRYLRATGLVSISQKGRSLEIIPEKLEDTKYFLDTIDPKPCFINDEEKYKQYLFNASLPVLYSDNRHNLTKQLSQFGITYTSDIAKKSTDDIKRILRAAINDRKERILQDQITKIKSYQAYQDVINVFRDIRNKNFYDLPLMLEWNTWRAMTMLDGGNIKANLKFDDYGQPMATASGNMADIICDYGDFALAVEVTMQSGQRQYEMEGEPVARHLAKLKKEHEKEAYCFFIAPKINDSCIAHFYTLHKINIAFYGGTSIIIPLELSVFEKMIEQSVKATYIPTPEQVKRFCDYSMQVAQNAKDEIEWYTAIKLKALNWLAA